MNIDLTPILFGLIIIYFLTLLRNIGINIFRIANVLENLNDKLR